MKLIEILTVSLSYTWSTAEHLQRTKETREFYELDQRCDAIPIDDRFNYRSRCHEKPSILGTMSNFLTEPPAVSFASVVATVRAV
jgi:hypothetical protein